MVAETVTHNAPMPQPIHRIEEPGSATVLTLGAHMCKWPIGDPSSDGFTCVRARRARSAGATFGARAAHSASDSSSARRTTDPSCSALSAPACAAAALASAAVANVSAVAASAAITVAVRSDVVDGVARDGSMR